jgi:hypothetical protein
MRKLVALIGLCGLACSKPETKAEVQPAITVQPSAVAAPAPPPEPEKPKSAMLTLVHFEKEDLVECAEFVLTPKDPANLAKAIEGLQKQGVEAKKSAGTLVVSKPCAEQLTDRVPLAQCAFPAGEKTAKEGWAFTQAITGYHYSIKRLSTDALMKECMERGGEWTVAAKDDPDAARERLRQHAKALQNLAE